MDNNFINTFVSDIKTCMIISSNQNYSERLKEAYDHIKDIGIKDYDDFKSREDVLVGAFTYNEITVFDRLKDENYKELLREAVVKLDRHNIQDLIDNKTLGDERASWGRLGYIPFRERYIAKGYSRFNEIRI